MHQRKLFILFLLAFGARISYLMIIGPGVQEDSVDYLRISTSILHGWGFAWGPGEETTFRLFGYPWFLALVYRFIPVKTAIYLVQILIGSATLVPVVNWAEKLGGKKAGWIAGLVMVFHPVLIYLTCVVTPDTIALFCLILMISFVWKIVNQESVRVQYVVGYIVCGTLAVLVRSEVVLLIGLYVIANGVYFLYRKCDQGKILVVASVAVIVFSVAPLAMRNWMEFNEFIPFPTVSGVTFWGANNPHSEGGWVFPHSIFWMDANPPDNGMRGWSGLTEKESEMRFVQVTLGWIKENPFVFVQLLPLKVWRSFEIGYGDRTKTDPVPEVFDFVNIGFALTALIGVIVNLRNGQWLVLEVFAIPLGGWFVKTLIYYGSARQSASVIPLFALFGAVAIVHLVQRIRTGRFS